MQAAAVEVLMPTYARIPVTFVRGEGAVLWDDEGRVYLDFIAGLAVNSLGHCHPRVVAAIREQAGRLMHVSNLFRIREQEELAQFLVERTCADRFFFCNSGAEANEAAIKLARKYARLRYGPEKYEIITAVNSFHGRTLATITATGQPQYQEGFQPLVPGFKYVPFNDAEALRAAISEHTCAVMLEPVQGEGGVIPAQPEYLRAVERICREQGLLLIFDEVQCGLGRTGRFMAYEHYGVEPDIFTLAKALGGGFPIGACGAKEEVAASFKPGDHASTFGGNPLACRAALAAMQALWEEGLIERAHVMGERLVSGLKALKAKYPVIVEVRGMGLMIGAEMKEECRGVVEACRAKGLLLNCCHGNVLRFLPPLVVTEEQVEKALMILDEALGEIYG